MIQAAAVFGTQGGGGSLDDVTVHVADFSGESEDILLLRGNMDTAARRITANESEG